MRITALMLYGAYALMSAPVVAQPVSKAADPAHSGARVPEIKYESAFRNYVPYREQPLATWREVNDEVGRVGGHVGMFGGAGHGGHAGATPASKSQPGAPTAPGTHTGR
ncbi:MAG TPA: hypothetical protein VFP00_04725 [Burkholderiales bacterium]|nr:hypothetical protein [Burkholderiales bacterium]